MSLHDRISNLAYIYMECLVARPGEGTLECNIVNPCRNCSDRHELIRAMYEEAKEFAEDVATECRDGDRDWGKTTVEWMEQEPR